MNKDLTQPLLLTVKETAALCGVSSRQIYRLSDAGHMPRPVRIGRSVRYRAAEINEWVEAGCPPIRTTGRAR